MPPDVIQDVQRPGPFSPFSRRQVYRLPISDIHPVVRIAHHVTVRHHAGERIIVDHELMLIRQGEGTLRIANRAIPMQPHRLVLIPPFVPHLFLPRRPVGNEHFAVHFDFAPAAPGQVPYLTERVPYAVRLVPHIKAPLWLQLSDDGADEIEIMMAKAAAAFAAGKPWSELEASLNIALVISTVLARLGSVANPRTTTAAARRAATRFRIQRVVTLLREHFADPIDIESLAATAQLSRSHFISAFREATGLTPAAMLQQIRVVKARELLVMTSLSMKEISETCGFGDQFQFSKIFHRATGHPPSEYRIQALQSRMIGDE